MVPPVLGILTWALNGVLGNNTFHLVRTLTRTTIIPLNMMIRYSYHIVNCKYEINFIWSYRYFVCVGNEIHKYCDLIEG